MHCCSFQSQGQHVGHAMFYYLWLWLKNFKFKNCSLWQPGQPDSDKQLSFWNLQVFEVTERTSRGFAGKWGEISSPKLTNTTRFEAPCCLRNDKEIEKEDGTKDYFSAVFLCRPAGQGKSMLLVRFGGTNFGNRLKWIPPWIIHKTSNTVFEQDMGFLASQNEVLVRKNVPLKNLYLNLKSSDTWVTEFRKWNDLTGHGMPYYFGHQSISLPKSPAMLEAAPAGPVAAAAISYPAKGSFGAMFAKDPTNRYFRHIVHCKSCLSTLNSFQKYQKVSSAHILFHFRYCPRQIACNLPTLSWVAGYTTCRWPIWHRRHDQMSLALN